MGLVSLKDGADGRGIAGIVLSSISLLLVVLAVATSISNPSTETNNTNKTSSIIRETTVIESNETQTSGESEKVDDITITQVSDSKTNDTKVTNISTKNKKTEYYVGDTLTSNLYDFTITKVTTKKRVGSSYFYSTPNEGGIYVCIEYEYKNISDAPISIWKKPSINLIDKNNYKYSHDISASSYYATEYDIDSKLLSDLNPGITVKDADVFEISKESWEKGGWTIKVDADKDFVVNIENSST